MIFKRRKKTEDYKVYVDLYYGNHNVHSRISFDNMETAVDFLKWIVKDPNYHHTKIRRY